MIGIGKYQLYSTNLEISVVYSILSLSFGPIYDGAYDLGDGTVYWSACIMLPFCTLVVCMLMDCPFKLVCLVYNKFD